MVRKFNLKRDLINLFVGCKFCSKRFSISKNAKVHLRVHTKERPFSCNHCNQKFSYKSTLKQHLLKIHQHPNSTEEILSK